MKNHFDKNGNYINVENLSLAEIYNRGYQDGSEDGLKGIRPHGKWVYRNDNPLIPSGYYECDRCEIGKSLTEQNYCPYCGADMRGGDNHVAI